MVNRVIIFLLLNLISISLLSAKDDSSSYCDSLCKIQNKEISLLKNEIKILNEKNSDIKNIQRQIDEVKNPDLPWSIKFIPIFVSIMAIIFTIGSGIISYVGFYKSKESNKEVNSALENIEKIKRDTIDFFKKYELQLNSKMDEFNNFEKVTTSRIGEKLALFATEAYQIKQIERDLSSHHSYIKHSIELLFDTLIWYANITKNKELLKSVFIKRAISNLYSFNEKERFSGISTLGQIGTLSEIEHLEHVIKDEFENANNKLFANQAIVNINMTSK
jgi:hypothetical protein